MFYNQAGNTDYMITERGQVFKGVQVTRQAVVQLIMDVIGEKSDRYVGVSESDTDWAKPLFY